MIEAVRNEVALKRPIKAHGDEVTTLVFREPAGDDIIACGYPLQMSGDGQGTFTPLAGVIAKYIARLGNIPPSSVKSMSAPDFNACMMAILPFFGEGDSTPVPDGED